MAANMHEMNHPDDQIINGSPIPTFIIDRDHTVTHWNIACEALTGLLAKDVIGTKNQWMAFYDKRSNVLADYVVDEPDEQKILIHFEGNARKSTLIDEAYEAEAYRLTQGAGGKWLFFTAAPLKNAAGQITGAIQTLQDISTTKLAEEREHEFNIKLAQTVSELQSSLELLRETQHHLVQSEKMAALGGLVAGVAHEINTPVGIGVTAASLLEEKTRECAALFSTQAMKRSDLEAYFQLALESSAMILSNLGRASDLIQRFKQVAVDQSCEEINTFRLRECLENHIMSLRPMLKKGAHSVQLQCHEDIVLKSYAGALGQIVSILIMNSLLHGFEETKAGMISIEVIDQANDIVLTYRDDGKGIPKENLEHIFEPFFTTKRNHGGTGLGLHILYNLVTQTLGGRIKMESEYGQGVVFRMQIPRISPLNRSLFFHATSSAEIAKVSV
ncbi:MAG: sensory box histidine kinase [Proteobacteria bacterium]|nr:sensory box histidine kinase [Pseudomonadota bacterium]